MHVKILTNVKDMMCKYIVFIILVAFISVCGCTSSSDDDNRAREPIRNPFGVKSISVAKEYVLVYLTNEKVQIASRANKPIDSSLFNKPIRVRVGEELVLSDGDHVATSLFLRRLRNKIAVINVEECHRPPMEEEQITKYTLRVDSVFMNKNVQ